LQGHDRPTARPRGYGVRPMSDPGEAARLWTVAEADAALGWVTALVERARAAAVATTRAAAGQAGTVRGNGHRPPTPDTDALEHALGELAAESILVRDLERGLIDFPAVSPSGRGYWLCWLVGEPQVAWWHWPETGFAGRTPISAPPA
jgi:hypothetical protein